MCELVDKVFGTEKSDNDCAIQQESFQVSGNLLAGG